LNKTEIIQYIKTHYSNLQQRILLLKVEYNAKSYIFDYDRVKTKLIYKKGKYTIEAA
jgi:hypothetical protein